MSGRSIQRVEELIATRVTEGLSPEDDRSLDVLLRRHPEIDAQGIELAAAAVYRELAPPAEPLPSHLRQGLVAAGRRELERQAGSAEVRAFPSRAGDAPSARPRLGWWAAAACLALAVAGWWPRFVAEPAATPRSTIAEQRQRLLAEAPDLQSLAWSATDDRAADGAAGDVVWSPSRQRGYMRIRNLEPNDPTVAQYQLWIFDRERDERYPVDGGVFDVPPDAEEAIIPIDAKIPVAEPYLFAVTVEPPGGVVVSDRERIVLVAEA